MRNIFKKTTPIQPAENTIIILTHLLKYLSFSIIPVKIESVNKNSKKKNQKTLFFPSDFNRQYIRYSLGRRINPISSVTLINFPINFKIFNIFIIVDSSVKLGNDKKLICFFVMFPFLFVRKTLIILYTNHYRYASYNTVKI